MYACRNSNPRDLLATVSSRLCAALCVRGEGDHERAPSVSSASQEQAICIFAGQTTPPSEHRNFKGSPYFGPRTGGGMPAGAARDSPVRPLHSGQLAKKTRSLFAGWQSRFCVLVGVRGAPSVTLRYWDSERAYQKEPHLARGEICMRVDPCNVLAHKVAGPVPTMHLQLPGRTWQFRAQEERQIDDWVGVFKKLADSRAEHVKQAAARAARPDPEHEQLPSVGELGMRIALRSRCEGHSAI